MKQSIEKVLLAVDLQTDFRDDRGRFDQILQWIEAHRKDYDRVVCTACRSSEGTPFARYTDWVGHFTPETHYAVEVPAPDLLILKNGYGLDDYRVLPREGVHYDVVGFNSDACVLKVALDLFDRDYDFTLLLDQCDTNEGPATDAAAKALCRNLLQRACL